MGVDIGPRGEEMRQTLRILQVAESESGSIDENQLLAAVLLDGLRQGVRSLQHLEGDSEDGRVGAQLLGRAHPLRVHRKQQDGPAGGQTIVHRELDQRGRLAAAGRTHQSHDPRLARPRAERGRGQPRIVALVGPPGCGKTTTLVKHAVNYGLAARRPVLLLSMETQRVGAAEQLRSYAAILGVAFQVLETTNALAQAIEENRGKELIFIDTPGFALGDLEDSKSLAHFLSTRPDIDTHLVLSASMKSADLTRMVDAFEILRPQHLLFTKLDETGSFGPIFSEAARTGKPLSFFTTGQRIPEDLEAVTQARLVDLIMTGQNRKQAAA